MFILCSELTLGTAPVTFLPQQLLSLGTMKLAMSSTGVGRCVGGSPVPTTAGKGHWKNSCKTHYDGLCCSEGKCVALDPASRVVGSARVLLNQVRSMVGGKALQFVAIVEVAPLAPIHFTRGEGGSLSAGSSCTRAESPGGDFFAEHLSQITFFSLFQLNSVWFPHCSCLRPEVLNTLITLGCPVK